MNKNNFSKISLIIVFLLFACGASYAQEGGIKTQQTTVEFSGKVNLNGSAADWGLTNSEWRKYKRLMKGEAGLFYGSASPQYVLAVYEKDKAKKREYARISLEQNKKRHEQTAEIFALQESIVKQEYGLVRGQKAATRRAQSSNKKWWRGLQNKRARIFVTANCEQCKKVAQEVVQGGRTKVDFFIVGAKNNDEIRAWATQLKMPIEKIQSKEITLNHGSELAKRLFVTEYPTSFIFDGENYELVSEGQ